MDLQIWQSCGCILLPLTRCPWRMLGGVSHVADMRPAHVPYHMGPGPTSVVGCTCMMTWISQPLTTVAVILSHDADHIVLYSIYTLDTVMRSSLLFTT